MHSVNMGKGKVIKALKSFFITLGPKKAKKKAKKHDQSPHEKHAGLNVSISLPKDFRIYGQNGSNLDIENFINRKVPSVSCVESHESELLSRKKPTVLTNKAYAWNESVLWDGFDPVSFSRKKPTVLTKKAYARNESVLWDGFDPVSFSGKPTVPTKKAYARNESFKRTNSSALERQTSVDSAEDSGYEGSKSVLGDDFGSVNSLDVNSLDVESLSLQNSSSAPQRTMPFDFRFNSERKSVTTPTESFKPLPSHSLNSMSAGSLRSEEDSIPIIKSNSTNSSALEHQTSVDSGYVSAGCLGGGSASRDYGDKGYEIFSWDGFDSVSLVNKMEKRSLAYDALEVKKLECFAEGLKRGNALADNSEVKEPFVEGLKRGNALADNSEVKEPFAEGLKRGNALADNSEVKEPFVDMGLDQEQYIRYLLYAIEVDKSLLNHGEGELHRRTLCSSSANPSFKPPYSPVGGYESLSVKPDGCVFPGEVAAFAFNPQSSCGENNYWSNCSVSDNMLNTLV